MAGEKTNATAKKFYRPGEIASEIGIAASTLRTWAERFAGHFDGGVSDRKLTPSGRPEMRVYTDNDLAVLRKIQELLAGGLTFDQVGERLAIVDLPAVIPEPDSQALAMVPALAEALTTVADQRRRLDDVETRLEALEKRARPWWAFWR